MNNGVYLPQIEYVALVLERSIDGTAHVRGDQLIEYGLSGIEAEKYYVIKRNKEGQIIVRELFVIADQSEPEDAE